MSASFLYFKKLMLQLFGITKSQFTQMTREQLEQARMKNILQIGISTIQIMAIDLSNVDDALFRERKKAFNVFCAQLYDNLAIRYPDKVQYFNMCFDVSESDLKNIALQCRYAIKLDHKGMANNASTIVSCLGLYLPTITYCGLLTGVEFKFGGIYSDAVIMPPEALEVIDGEVRPHQNEKFLDNVCMQILFEDAAIYRKRLQQLQQLRKVGMFTIESTTQRLIEEMASLIQLTHRISGPTIRV